MVAYRMFQWRSLNNYLNNSLPLSCKPSEVIHRTVSMWDPSLLRHFKSLLGKSSIRGWIQKFPDWVITKYMLTTINSCWEATQRVMAAKLTRLTHKIAIQLQLVAKSCITHSCHSRRPVRKLLDTPSYSAICDKSPTQLSIRWVRSIFLRAWSWPLTSI
jgi:hypothetical protein